MGLFGSTSKKLTSYAYSQTQDQRTGVGGSVGGSMISPGAAVGGTGSVVAGSGANVTQNITSTGLPSSDVKGLMDSLLGSQESERSSYRDMSSQLAGGLAQQGQALGAALAATRTPDSTQLTAALPFIILGLILYFWK